MKKNYQKNEKLIYNISVGSQHKDVLSDAVGGWWAIGCLPWIGSKTGFCEKQVQDVGSCQGLTRDSFCGTKRRMRDVQMVHRPFFSNGLQ